MKQLILVFVGGGTGSVCRFLVGKWFYNAPSGIPYGTLLANVLGSLLIGLILGYAAKTQTLSESTTLLLATGFCGGFTTFSTFAYENHLLLKAGDFIGFATYLLLSILVGIAAVFIGMFVVRSL